MERFSLTPAELTAKLATISKIEYTKPRELGVFSYDEQRNLTLDKSQLKRFYPAEDLFKYGDLSHNFPTFVEKMAMDHVDPILAVLQNLPTPLPPNIDFITWRGVLTRILATPYDHKTEWCMHGMLRNNVIYIDEQRLPKNLSRREQEATYWGHKFETLCMINNATKDTSHLEPLAIRREVPVNTNAEFGTVVQTRLGRFRFILGAEVDGLDQRGEEYIELKTSKIRERPFDYQNFNQKLMKYWLQSFLIGIETVVVGFRDKKGALKTLEGLKVSEMPRRVRSQGIWDPNAILLMGDLFFTWLHERVMHYAKPCSRGLEVSFRIRHVEGGIIDFDLLPELPSFIPIWFTQYS